MNVHGILLAALSVVGAAYLVFWIAAFRSRGLAVPGLLGIAIGFVTNFLDTLGIGSFAPTTAMYKLWRVVPDETIPGTLNVGDAIPTVVEALIFIAIVNVDALTLIALILAAILGAYLGAGVVARLSRTQVQIGMGAALLVAAVLFALKNLSVLPGGGSALGLQGVLLAVGIFVNFCLGALMTLGIGLYAPAMIMVSLLGMSPLAAFPIMMGSCAFLMPVASVRFIRLNRYDLGAALGLTIGGVPGVLIAAYIVKSLPLTAVRWLVVVVVIYAAVAMLRSALASRELSSPAPSRA